MADGKEEASLSGRMTEARHGTRQMADGTPHTHARPLLKWAGGKRQLLPVLRRFYPRQFNRYCEPFLGSAAVFFDLHARGLVGGGATLTDHNPDLIACYRAVRDFPDEIVRELTRLARDHERKGTDHYYEIRNNRFNKERARLRASANGGELGYSPALAAMFIYLNRTGYNGLFRLNSAGEFNVPAGRYSKPRICDDENIRLVSAALARSSVALEQGAIHHRPGTGTGRRFPVLRSAVCAAEQDGTVHQLHRRRIQPGRPGDAANGAR